jgi:hypothetical protein
VKLVMHRLRAEDERGERQFIPLADLGQRSHGFLINRIWVISLGKIGKA